MVKAVDAETPAAVALLEKIVNINSGTMNLRWRDRGEGCGDAADRGLASRRGGSR